MPSRVRFHARPGFGRSSRVLLAASAFAVAGQQAQAINVYLVASGDPTVDAQVQGILAAHGHTSVIGQFWTQFDGTESMAGIDAVYLQHIGFSFGDMPESGQTFLRDWVRAGGGLVTGAGAVVEAGQGRLTTLGAILPAEPSDFEYFADSLTFEQVVADPILSAGLPSSFTFSAMGARRGLLSPPGRQRLLSDRRRFADHVRRRRRQRRRRLGAHDRPRCACDAV